LIASQRQLPVFNTVILVDVEQEETGSLLTEYWSIYTNDVFCSHLEIDRVVEMWEENLKSSQQSNQVSCKPADLFTRAIVA
jgi:hypothetical protein